MTADVLLAIAREAARVAPQREREDVAGDVVLTLMEQAPTTEHEAREIARRSAHASRMRASRRDAHRASLDGAHVGATHAEVVVDQAASRILLDAALSAARTGRSFNVSRTLRLIG